MRAGIFHRTNIDGYFGIKSDGFILPNDGQYSFSYPQSENSYGYDKRYISLFDFNQATLEECIITHNTWGPFLSDQKPITIFLKLDHEKLSSKLIPNSKAPNVGDKEYKIYIPFVEAWYPSPLPFNYITTFYLSFYNHRDHNLIFKEFVFSQRSYFEELLDYIK